jgi:hypothetical protein
MTVDQCSTNSMTIKALGKEFGAARQTDLKGFGSPGPARLLPIAILVTVGVQLD